MSQHHSLGAEFTPLPSLHPVEIMEPYVPCWCLSGKKWKFCHKDRESKKPVPIGRLFKELRLITIKGYCAHPHAGADCGKIVNAHTIQRRGGLSEIAEKGHVYSVKEGGRDIVENEGRILPRKSGCRAASTFAGFCGKHDTKMFAPIENSVPDLSKENIFLFSFRAVAYEQFYKRSAHACMDVQRQADYGQPFEVQAGIQQHLHHMKMGIERGLADIDDWKAQYDAAYSLNDYEKFGAYGCVFAEVLPVACCGAFHPEVSFGGDRLQMIGRGDRAFEHMAISLTPLNGRTVLTIGWFGAKGGPAFHFARSFMALNDAEKANAAMHLAFEHLENTFITPSWWDELDDVVRERLIERSMTGMGLVGPERSEKALTQLEPVLSAIGIEHDVLLGFD